MFPATTPLPGKALAWLSEHVLCSILARCRIACKRARSMTSGLNICLREDEWPKASERGPMLAISNGCRLSSIGGSQPNTATRNEAILMAASRAEPSLEWRGHRRSQRQLLAGPGPMASCAASSAFLGLYCHDVWCREYMRSSVMSQRTGSILKASTATPRSTPSPLPVNAIDVVPLVSTWAVPLLPAPAEAPACA